MLFTGYAQYPDTKVVMKAMQDEMTRSMKDLKLENLPRPYYIEYQLKVVGEYNSSAFLGNIINSNSNFNYILNVSVRVGDYKFDNSNFVDIGFSFFGSTDDEERFTNRSIPEEINYDILRRQLWLATDAAYKQSSEVYSKKLASIQNITRKDTIPDFSIVQPRKSYDTTTITDFKFENYLNLIKKLSSQFKGISQIYTSKVNFEYLPTRIYYLNSEGMEFVKDEFFSGIEAICYTQTPEGTPIAEHYSAYSRNPKNLPSPDSLSKAVNEIISKLVLLANQPSLEDNYNGPVIFEGQAAGEIISRVFAPNLIAQREKVSEGMFSGFGGRFFSFQKKIGGRVLPEFISVIDNPKETYFKKTELLGFYTIDDQGLEPQKVTLVENGFLKTLLNDRTPIKRVTESNGHRRGGVPMFSNLYLLIDPMKALSTTDLKKKLLELVKQRELPYGIIIRKVMNLNIFSTSLLSNTFGAITYMMDQNSIPLIEAYKVYPDGREELIKNIQLNSLSHQSFKDILWGSKELFVHNLLAQNPGGGFGSDGAAWIPASIIAPSLLFEDLEISAIDKDTPKPPFLSNPIKN